MKLQKVLTTALLGAGLGALTLPGIALANVGAHPSVAPVGTTITLTARCKPPSKGPRPSATFHITGPRKDHQAGPDTGSGRGPESDRGSRTDRENDRGNSAGAGTDRGRGPGAGTDRERGAGAGTEKERGTSPSVDISVESTGTEAKMPDTVSAQLPTNNWQPGEYDVKAKCSDGTVAGQSVFTLTPHGGPRGGEGGQPGNDALVAAGTAMLGASAIGFVLLRRQRPGTATD